MTRSRLGLTLALGSVLAAAGLFLVPVSFSVQGFGMVVSPEGVRIIRSVDAGTVHHAEPTGDGWFAPGRIVTLIEPIAGGVRNTFLVEKLRRDLQEITATHGEKLSKLRAELAREKAGLSALADRVVAGEARAARIARRSDELTTLRAGMRAEIESLSTARLDHLDTLEEMLHRTGELGVVAEQQRLQTMQQLYSDRSATIRNVSGGFPTDALILDLHKELEQLEYTLAIDRAEQDILAARVGEMRTQVVELERLRALMVREAESSYVAGVEAPQVVLSTGWWRDQRVVQTDGADVARNEVVRLVEAAGRATGICLTVFGPAAELSLRIGIDGAGQSAIDLVGPDGVVRDGLVSLGLRAGPPRRDRLRAGASDVQTVFIPIDAGEAPPGVAAPDVLEATARTADGLPLPVDAIFLAGSVDIPAQTPNALVGFVENRHALVLSPGQPVHLVLKDSRNAGSFVLAGRVGDARRSTVDTTELALRLGNESLARKFIAKSVLSQVSIVLPPSGARRIEHLRGAIVGLSFPLERQSLFDFLVSRHVAG